MWFLSSFDRKGFAARYNRLSKGSVLLTLLHTGLFKPAEYLIRCGWQLEKESWFSSLKISELKISTIWIGKTYRKPDVQDGREQFQNFIDNIDQGPKSLTIICRNSIRRLLATASRGTEIETKINLLPIPMILKSFLVFRDFLQDKEMIKLENWKIRIGNYENYV